MRNTKFYFNDISIIYKDEIFIFAEIFNLKTLNKSRDCLSVFSLENYTTQIQQYANKFDFIAILQEDNNTHVILINQNNLYEKLCKFKKSLYEAKRIELSVFIDLIGPVRRFAFPNNFEEYSKKFGIKIYIDNDNELIISKEFIATNDVESTKESGKDFLIRLCNNLSYVNKMGINVRHISCAEINNTGISYSIGETHSIIKKIEIDKGMQLFEISKKDTKLYDAIIGLNQSYTSITAKQSLISLWSTIETLFSGKSSSLFSPEEQKNIVSFIEKNIDTKKSIIINDQLPNLKKNKRNDIIIENILNLDKGLKKQSVDKTIRRASKLRGKCSHTNTDNIDEKEIKNCNQELKKIIKLFISKKEIGFD